MHKSVAEKQDTLNGAVEALMSCLLYQVINYYGQKINCTDRLPTPLCRIHFITH